MDGATTLSETLGIDQVIRGLGDDLVALRAGEISTNDARARAELAKQIMAGFRLVLQGRQFIERNLPPPVNHSGSQIVSTKGRKRHD